MSTASRDEPQRRPGEVRASYAAVVEPAEPEHGAFTDGAALRAKLVALGIIVPAAVVAARAGGT